MPLFKRFTKPKCELEAEVTPRAAYTYDCDSDSSSSSVAPGELIYPALQPYVDRGSLLASVLNDSLAAVLDKLGPYSYNANLTATPMLLTLFSDRNPDRCMFATPHMMATITPTSVSWGWNEKHSINDPVVRALRCTGKRDGVPELSNPEIKFPLGWPPKGKKVKNDALAVLAHQLGAAAVGARLGQRRGAPITRRSSNATSSTYTTYSSVSASFSEDIPSTPRTPPRSSDSPTQGATSPSMPQTPVTSTLYPMGDPPTIGPYFIAPRNGNYAVFLLDFGPSILRSRKTIAEVGPSIRRLLSNGPPVKDHREAFRGLAYGMGWACDETTTMLVAGADVFKDDAMSIITTSTRSAAENVQTHMRISDDGSSIDVTFDGAGRLTGIKMQLEE